MEKEEQKESKINCYFLCKSESEIIKFIGFNNENLKIEFSDSEKKKFQNSCVYYFQNLKQYENKVLFIKDSSYFSKSEGIQLKDKKINFNKLEPFTIIGKVMEKQDNKLVLLTPFLNKIIVISSIGQIFKNINDYQYICIYYIRFDYEEDNGIYFSMTNFTSIKILKDKTNEFDRINAKICLKFNLLDLEKKDDENGDIQISKIALELNEKNLKNFKINNKVFYFVYENEDYDYDYFPQSLYLYNAKDLIPYKLQFFVYKGFMKEVNLFIRNKCSLAYEFLYFSLDGQLPNEIEIIHKKGKKLKANNFHTFNCRTRKSITFINIPPQNNEDIGYDNSFLYIYLCNKSEKKLYGKFCLNSIEIKRKKDYHFNPNVILLIYEIYADFIGIINKSSSIEKLKGKYLSFSKNINQNLEKEIRQKFYLFNFSDEEYTLNYFNSLCLWNLFYYINQNSSNYYCIKEYIILYQKISKRNDLNFVEKSMILICFVERIFECKQTFNTPKLFFYKDLDDSNPYKIAYNFQYQIIDNISEESCLFLPFLFLDSYIMNCIYTKNFSFIKKFLSAYSISMLPIDSIKIHLKKTIKDYFFVLERSLENERKYYASVHKFNFLVTYNENILLKNSSIKSIFDCDQFYETKENKNLAFIINLENLHENFSHNKEELINIKDSPTLFFNSNYEFSYIYHYETKDYGEAGRLVETFIAKEYIIDEMKKVKYKMGAFLEVKYYVDKDFNALIEGFIQIRDTYNEKQNIINDLKDDNNLEQSSTNTNLIQVNNSKVITKKKEKIIEKKENIDLKDKNSNDDNRINDNIIYLSTHNTYVLKAKTLEDLMQEIENIEKKKIIIKSKDAIENVENNNMNINY